MYTEILLHIMMIINKPMIIDLNKIPIKCHPKQLQQQIVVDLHHHTCREFNSIDMQTYRATTENVIHTYRRCIVLHYSYYYTYDDDDDERQR